MSKRSAPEKSIAELQPDELNALKDVVKEFMKQVGSIDNEIELLKGDRKEVIQDFSEKLDMKTLQTALRVIKLQNSVAHKDAYDLFMEALTTPTTVM
jgi:uncharacterized protein (UPF0335 family)